MVHRFLNVVFIFKILIKVSQQYNAYQIGAACNYRIPQANLHAVLYFVHAKMLDSYPAFFLPIATTSNKNF